MTILALMAALAVQTTTPAPAPAPALDVSVPAVPGVTADPTCGGRPALTGLATCVATTQAAIEGVVSTYTADFERQGWLAAGGSENLVVYVRRRPEGGCDGFQLMAFTGENAFAAPAGPAYLALAAVPGDVCAARPAESAVPATPPAP